VDEVLPGDTMNLNARMLARMNSMIYPIMDNVFLDTMYFFVPTRLVWRIGNVLMGHRIIQMTLLIMRFLLYLLQVHLYFSKGTI